MASRQTVASAVTGVGKCFGNVPPSATLPEPPAAPAAFPQVRCSDLSFGGRSRVRERRSLAFQSSQGILDQEEVDRCSREGIHPTRMAAPH
jgi:hypothetical protein